MARTITGGGRLLECALTWRGIKLHLERWYTFTLIQGAIAEFAISIDCNATVIQAINWTQRQSPTHLQFWFLDNRRGVATGTKSLNP